MVAISFLFQLLLVVEVVDSSASELETFFSSVYHSLPSRETVYATAAMASLY
jgi:hypothetical protein